MSFFYDDLQTFLLNLFFVFILFFIYHKYIEKRISQVTHKVFIALISGLSIILCMTFAIAPAPGFIFDMRQVPFIVGALYGGRRVALFLLTILLTYRYNISVDDGFYASFIIYSVLFLCLCFVIPWFNKTHQIKYKVLMSVLISIFGFVFMIIIVFSFNPYIIPQDLLLLLGLYFTQYVSMGFFVHVIEKTRKDILILEELKKLEKLKLVGDIAASISHEVRNPLTVTRGFIQLLRDSNLTEEQKNVYITYSINELDRAEHIITDYLTFAKPSFENTKLLEFNKELDYVINVITPYATMKNVHVEVNKEKCVHIIGEAQKLHQCLLNIMKNGIEAMEHGGALTVSLTIKNDRALLLVKDTGKGMNAEQISRLGIPYYSTKDKGTGLGTMVAYSIIKLMRGEIRVYSEVGKGTKFTITLPLAPLSLKQNQLEQPVG